MKRIILASGSPRRKMLLEWAEINFEVIVSDTEESFSPKLSPPEIAISIAEKKNHAVAATLGSIISDIIIIAADTIVVLDNEIIGKPTDRNNAIEIIKKLSGKKHQVITAVSIRDDKKDIHFYDTTEVEFHELSIEQIVHYVDHYKPYDKAGAYAIQEWIGVIGIRSINGDFYNVMGLPVSKVMRVLHEDFHYSR